jgi:hypothetical protein
MTFANIHGIFHCQEANFLVEMTSLKSNNGNVILLFKTLASSLLSQLQRTN